MIHPEIMAIAREEDVKAWRQRESKRIRRRRATAKAAYWTVALAVIGWVTWDGVTRVADGLLW